MTTQIAASTFLLAVIALSAISLASAVAYAQVATTEVVQSGLEVVLSALALAGMVGSVLVAVAGLIRAGAAATKSQAVKDSLTRAADATENLGKSLQETDVHAVEIKKRQLEIVNSISTVVSVAENIAGLTPEQKAEVQKAKETLNAYAVEAKNDLDYVTAELERLKDAIPKAKEIAPATL